MVRAGRGPGSAHDGRNHPDGRSSHDPRAACGVRSDAGYDPRAQLRVMELLAEAGGPDRQPEFFSTHPNPENRMGRIEAAIREVFPGGVPAGLEP